LLISVTETLLEGTTDRQKTVITFGDVKHCAQRCHLSVHNCAHSVKANIQATGQ